MSRSALIRLFFGEGEFEFALRIGQLEQLQELTGRGPGEVFGRLQAGTWFVKDVTETLRLGLIGGGMARDAAHDLVRRNCNEGYWSESVAVAFAVLAAALVGVPDEPVGEPPGEVATVTTPPPGSSDASTATGPS